MYYTELPGANCDQLIPQTLLRDISVARQLNIQEGLHALSRPHLYNLKPWQVQQDKPLCYFLGLGEGGGRGRRSPQTCFCMNLSPVLTPLALPVVSGSQASLTSLCVFRFVILSCNRLSRLDFVKSTTTTTKKNNPVLSKNNHDSTFEPSVF